MDGNIFWSVFAALIAFVLAPIAFQYLVCLYIAILNTVFFPPDEEITFRSNSGKTPYVPPVKKP